MQQHSSRMGGRQLGAPAFASAECPSLLCSAIDRLIRRLLPRRARKPISHSGHDVEPGVEQRLNAMRQALDEQAMLLRMVVHDLRMPLTSIQGYTDLLQQGIYGPLSDEQATVLERIKYSTMFLDRLSSSLLDAVPAETHTLSLAHETFDPRQIAQKVLGDCHPQAVQQGLTLQFRSMGDLPQIVGDPDRVREVLFNLLGNALRYTTSGCITLSVEAITDTVEFRVEDTGPGIAQEMQEVIWKPFTRATDRGDGVGIGLYTVQRLTQAMGGSVGMQSTPGAGSAFWIRLPYQELGKVIGKVGAGH
jgi:two-component system, sensor histidine kinase